MADPRTSDTKARQPGVNEYARHVYGAISYWILLRKKTMYSVQCSILGRRHINLL